MKWNPIWLMPIGHPTDRTSQIRLVTSPLSSPDTVRLWLERSGPHVPLDIEVFLKVPNKTRGRSQNSVTPAWPHTLPPVYQPAPILPPPPALPTGLVQPYTTIPAIHIVPAAQTMMAAPPSPTQDPWGLPDDGPSWRGQPSPRGAAAQWGHVAVYYLVQQLHRWERFVFRCDKQFTSMSALKAIMGAYGRSLRSIMTDGLLRRRAEAARV